MNYLSPKKKQPEQSYQLMRLFVAIYNGWTNAIIGLAKSGVNLNVTTETGITPLHIASMLGNNMMVKVLIKHGADVNCREKNYLSTPLHFASIKGNVRNIQNLIELSKEVVDRGHDIARDIILTEGIMCSAKSYETVILTLVKKGADLNAKDVYGKTALHLAVQYRSEAVKTLLGLSADVDSQDNEGRLPWHYAIQYDNYEGLQWLLAFGADINDFNVYSKFDLEQIKFMFKYSSSHMGQLMIEQLTRLKAATLPVSKVYADYVDKHSSQSYFNECAKEVRKMEYYEVEDGVSLYNLLHMSPRRKAAYTKTTDKTKSMLIVFESEFPNYYGIIRASFFDENKRKPMLKTAKSAWYLLTNINLPDICVEHILSYLNSCELKTMVEGVKQLQPVK